MVNVKIYTLVGACLHLKGWIMMKMMMMMEMIESR